MTIALRSPDTVGALISVDNAPVDAALTSDFPKYIRGMRRIEDAQITKQIEAEDIMKEYESVCALCQTSPLIADTRISPSSKSLPIRQFLLTNLIRPLNSKFLRFRVPVATLAAALGNMGDFPFRDPDEAQFKKPALFIRGTKSSYIADDVLPLIGRFFPRFQLRDIASGHWVISEKPEEFRAGKVARSKLLHRHY